jgi:hypothetical protein
MNAVSIRVLLCLAGCTGLAALADDPVDSPTQELLESYTYIPQPLVVPPTAPSPPLTSLTMVPSIPPNLQPRQRTAHDLRDLSAAIAREKKHGAPALVILDLSWDTQLEVLAKPNVQKLNVPWMPIMAMEETPFTPSNATRDLEARLPALELLW